MLSAGNADSFPRANVLVVFSERLEAQIRRIVSTHSPWDWERRGQVLMLPIPVGRLRDASYVTGAIDTLAYRTPGILDLFCVGEGVKTRSGGRMLRLPQVNVQALRGDVSVARNNVQLTMRRFEDVFPKKLKERHLDWMSCVEHMLANAWAHGTVDRERIELWLGQFDSLGSSRWIGERLLRLLEFWPSSKVIDAIGGASDLEGFSFVCVNRQTPGKSADVLATQLQKRIRYIRAGQVRDFYEHLNTDEAGSILYVEDCLLTGTEMVSVLKALLGQTPSDRRPKTPSLADASKLKSRDIHARFAVVANWGLEALRRFLLDQGLSNIVVSGHGGRSIETLTSAGLEALRSGCLYDHDKCLIDETRHVRPVVFQDASAWGDDVKRERAIAFCKDVGMQLFRAYLDRKNWNWPPPRAAEGALGARGNALALAFAHSVPKETLPLFWMDSLVSMKGKTLFWEPLFPNAD